MPFCGAIKIFIKKPQKITNRTNKSTNNGNKDGYSTRPPFSAQEGHVLSTIDENFGLLKEILGNGIGLVEGKYAILNDKLEAGVAYIEGIADKILISRQVIEPILKGRVDSDTGSEDILTQIQSKFIYVPDIKKSSDMKQVVDSLLYGDTVLFIDGAATALIIGSRKVEKRAIEKPDNENTVSASMESFIEDLETNCSLIIKRLPTPDLRFETFSIGELTRSKIKLVWLEGIANTKVIEEVRGRIESIEIDVVDGIGGLGELIADNPLSVFPTYRQTQRPDVTAKNLSSGHFAILCGNCPFVLIAPASFWDNFKTMDDYAEKPLISSYLRIARYIAFLLNVLVSPLYLAFVTYNHAIVPPALALNIATGRDGVPFPSFIELLILTLAITIIREASLRMPGAAGIFIGTLSAVVIGQAAVNAGYVSASVIIVVAISAISSFAVSTTLLVYPGRLINYFFILMAGTFGMFGLINGIVIVLWHAVSLESFGVPYLYPLIPFNLEGMKDTFIRAPVSVLKKRLRILAPYNRIRMNNKKYEEE